MQADKGDIEMKYIIRNCPCFVEGIAIKGMERKTQTCNNHKIRELMYCQDCTDCLLKQIVKITKNYNKGCGKHCDINRKENNCGKTCNAYKIRQILELLDIEECSDGEIDK